MYYPVSGKNDNSDNGESTLVNDVGNELTPFLKMDNLLPNTEYHISVTAYTNVGPGTVANLSVTTTSTAANTRKGMLKV